MERLSVSGPWITQREIDYVTDAVTNAWYANSNVYNARFEAAFAAYTGRKHAISLPSCTAALHLALLARGIGPGDEVIVPDATWIASAAPISYVGATTVFADIDERSWCIDPKSVESVITPRTRAIIVVNLYGNMPDVDGLTEVAARHDLSLIEDAAESVGSEYKGRKAGSFGLASTFSFHGSKTLTTGEGGMLLSDDTAFVDRCLFLRDHGRKPGDRMFYNHEVAHKYKMSSMQAALGLAQLERIDELVARKREIFAWYREALHGTRNVTLNHESPDVKNTYWMVTVVVDSALRLPKIELMSRLSDAGIDSRPFFHPLSAIPAYAEHSEAVAAARRNAVSYRVTPQAVNLPSGFNMTREKVGYVCEQLKAILDEAGRSPSA